MLNFYRTLVSQRLRNSGNLTSVEVGILQTSIRLVNLLCVSEGGIQIRDGSTRNQVSAIESYEHLL